MNTPPFSLRQLQYAVAVADERNFRKAAEKCHVSQPSLSAQLAQLEDALGARLFERDRNRVIPTPAGDELLARARRLLAEVDALAAAARHLGDPLAGTLRVGIIPTVSQYVLPALVAAVRDSHPKLGILWTEEKTQVLLAALQAGNLEAALIAQLPALGEVECVQIAEDPFVLAGPRGHPLLKKRGPVRNEELAGERLLLLDDGHCFRDQALAICSHVSAREADFRATSLSTLAQMVAGGAGLTLLPTLSLLVENRRGELSLRKLEPPAPGRTLVLAFRKSSPLGPALRELAETLKRGCREDKRAPGIG